MINAFQTTNAALAACLATCGVPFAREGEKEIPAVHIYTTSRLRTLGYHRMKPMDAAVAARDDGHQGTLVFCFQRTEILEQVLKAWDEQSELIRLAGPQPPVLADPTELARACCQFAKNANVFRSTWKNLQAYYKADRPGDRFQLIPLPQ